MTVKVCNVVAMWFSFDLVHVLRIPLYLDALSLVNLKPYFHSCLHGPMVWVTPTYLSCRQPGSGGAKARLEDRGNVGVVIGEGKALAILDEDPSQLRGRQARPGGRARPHLPQEHTKTEYITLLVDQNGIDQDHLSFRDHLEGGHS